jgi:hypothetical protein
MCTGLEIILPLIGSALSVGGTAMQQHEQQRMAQQQAEARNEALRATMMKNDRLARESRQTFDQRLQKGSKDTVDQQNAKAGKNRAADLQKSVEATAEMEDTQGANISGTAPTIVGSDLAKRMQSVLKDGKDQATALGKLGAYGDSWMKQGFMDTQAGRDIGVTTNKAAGNSAIMPYAQDFAEMQATHPLSPIGSIIAGIGGAMGSIGGSGTTVPRKTYTTPFLGGPTTTVQGGW